MRRRSPRFHLHHAKDTLHFCAPSSRRGRKWKPETMRISSPFSRPLDDYRKEDEDWWKYSATPRETRQVPSPLFDSDVWKSFFEPWEELHYGHFNDYGKLFTYVVHSLFRDWSSAKTQTIITCRKKNLFSSSSLFPFNIKCFQRRKLAALSPIMSNLIGKKKKGEGKNRICAL